jgi:hypothetical protein
MKKILFVIAFISFFVAGNSQQVLNSKNIAVSQLEKKAGESAFIVLDSTNTAGQVVIVKSRSNGFRVRTKSTMSTLEKKKMVDENAVVVGTTITKQVLPADTEEDSIVYFKVENGRISEEVDTVIALHKFVFKEGKTFIEKSGDLVAFSGELSKENKDQQELSKKLKTGLFVKKDENTYRIYGPAGIYKGPSPFK